MRKKEKISISLIVLVLVISSLIVAAIYLNADEVTSNLSMLSMEKKILFSIMFALILLFTIILVVYEIIEYRRLKYHREEDNITTNNIVTNVVPVLQNVVTSDTEAPSTEKRADGQSRFYQLTQIDKEYLDKESKKFVKDIDLKTLCEDFRNFACYRLNLYYSIDDIRRFIAGLSVSKLLILQGMSGTGKTSLAYAFGEYLGNSSIVVPIQPMWKERTDLIGYYNEFTKMFNETELLQKMYEANYSEEIYIVVLDEMNIARIEYYFAEFLSLLEIPNPEGRYLDVVSDKWDNDPKKLVKGRIKLPENMWFIGTANNDDSTFAISDKVYDRAMVLNLDKKSEMFTGQRTDKKSISYEYFEKLVNSALSEYEMTTRNRNRIMELDAYLIHEFHITFGNRMMKQINQYVPIYVACGGSEVEAIDDFMSKKVLRKLESQNLVYVKSKANDLCNKLDELFGENTMQLCKEFINKIKDNA